MFKVQFTTKNESSNIYEQPSPLICSRSTSCSKNVFQVLLRNGSWCCPVIISEEVDVSRSSNRIPSKDRCPTSVDRRFLREDRKFVKFLDTLPPIFTFSDLKAITQSLTRFNIHVSLSVNNGSYLNSKITMFTVSDKTSRVSGKTSYCETMFTIILTSHVKYSANSNVHCSSLCMLDFSKSPMIFAVTLANLFVSTGLASVTANILEAIFSNNVFVFLPSKENGIKHSWFSIPICSILLKISRNSISKFSLKGNRYIQMIIWYIQMQFVRFIHNQRNWAWCKNKESAPSAKAKKFSYGQHSLLFSVSILWNSLSEGINSIQNRKEL